jgi:3-oxoadipate enol-lactonase
VCNDHEMTALHSRVEGSGPTVVLLHAGVADSRMWDPQVAALSREHTVVRCDLRGFGGSPLSPGLPSCDAEDVLALLDELEVGQFFLIGASYGGQVALQVASAVPDRVERLVLLAPAADLVEPDESLRSLWTEEKRLVDAGDLDAATELNVRAWLGPDADQNARDSVRGMQREALAQQSGAGDVESRDLPVHLDRLTMPTTVFAGAHDFEFFKVTARELAARLPRARLVELPWAGHLPTVERPDDGARLLLEALGGSETGPEQENEDQDHPPSREGLSDSEVWEWVGDHWRIRTIAGFEEPNRGGSPAPVDDP